MILGRLTYGLLTVAVLSGVALAPFWSAARPLESLETQTGATPWGFWLRGVHALSSWGFLAGTLAHLVEVLWKKTDRRLARALHARGVSVQSVDDALLLASVRRFARPLPSGPPPTARSLAYFIPVVDELLATPIDDGYRRYLASVLERAISRPF